jgi:hypothetical protein
MPLDRLRSVRPLPRHMPAIQHVQASSSTTATATTSPADSSSSSSSGGSSSDSGPLGPFIDPYNGGVELSQQQVMALVAENMAADARLAGSSAPGALQLAVLHGAHASRALLSRLLRSLRWAPADMLCQPGAVLCCAVLCSRTAHAAFSLHEEVGISLVAGL